MDMFNLNKKVAVVFGGNGYLGKYFCKSLKNYGAKVYSCDLNINESKKKKTTSKSKEFAKIEKIMVNAANKEELIELRKKIMEKEKSVDILVNTTTAKGEGFYLPFEDVSLECWDVGISGNLTIPFLTIQNFIPIMKKQKNGSIINIASHYGIVGNDQRIYIGADLNKHYGDDKKEKNRIYSNGVYNAAKGGLINFTRYLAAYYGEYNIRVNCISPGGVYKKNCENKTFTKKYSEKVPLRRRANPEEISGALIFLASNASSYVTGHNLVVDGGYTIW